MGSPEDSFPGGLVLRPGEAGAAAVAGGGRGVTSCRPDAEAGAHPGGCGRGKKAARPPGLLCPLGPPGCRHLCELPSPAGAPCTPSGLPAPPHRAACRLQVPAFRPPESRGAGLPPRPLLALWEANLYFVLSPNPSVSNGSLQRGLCSREGARPAPRAACAAGRSGRPLAPTPGEVAKCPTSWLAACLKIKMGLRGPGIPAVCH